MKIIVQIPVFNEEKHLPLVIDDIRRNFARGVSVPPVIIVINDGSTDKSAEIASGKAVDAVVDLKGHCGLGAAFKEGLKCAIRSGADIIVNTDADLQYNAAEIQALTAPILENKADMVIGDRQIHSLRRYPYYKYAAQTMGNFFVSKMLGADIKDANSGFRAFSREAAQLLVENMDNPYTYTIESICILLNKKKRIVFVPVRINNSLRESRLIKSKIGYVKDYIATVLRYFLKKRHKRRPGFNGFL